MFSSNSVGGGSESTGCNSRGSGQLYNWQATKTSVHERFAFMFNNELLADIHFKVNIISNFWEHFELGIYSGIHFLKVKQLKPLFLSSFWKYLVSGGVGIVKALQG